MAVNTSTAEFTLPKRLKTDKRGPVRWIISHALHHWFLGLSMILGALCNAALAAVVPIIIGQAFNAILATPPDIQALWKYALWVVGTQLLRGGVARIALKAWPIIIGTQFQR